MKSVEKYRLYDLATLAVMGIILEILCMKVTSGFASFGLAISIIALIRWGLPGIIVSAVIGLGSVIGIQWISPSLNNLGYEFLVYVFGNLGIILSYLILPKISEKNLKKTFEILLLYAIIGYIGQSFCRSFIITLYVNDFTNLFDPVFGSIDINQAFLVGTWRSFWEIIKFGFVVNITGTFLMPLFISGVVLFIVSRIDGILVDPVKYIVKQREEIKRSYDVFEGFNIPDEEPKEDEKEENEDKEVDEDE